MLEQKVQYWARKCNVKMMGQKVQCWPGSAMLGQEVLKEVFTL